MRALDGLTLDLAPRQPSIGNRCLLAGAYLIMLLLVALPALCPAMGSGAGVAGTALVEPVVSAVHPASTATDVVDRLDAQSAASWQLNPDQDHRASSTSMQAGDDVDPDDDGLSLALASSSRLLSLPTGALAPRPDPRRPLDRTEAPPDRPPTPAS
jgi:hypothetical protein